MPAAMDEPQSSPAAPNRVGTLWPPGQPETLPGWRVSHWFNTASPIALEDLRGRVVLVHAFQMLCPACVTHGLPQALRVRQAFRGDGVTVVGLHTVFEHHEVMGPTALQAFIHEYRMDFPIAVDEAAEAGPVPRTMVQWGLRGTPSVVLFDRRGRARLHRFGIVDDLVLGAAIGQLLAEQVEAASLARGDQGVADNRPPGCDGDVCTI